MWLSLFKHVCYCLEMYATEYEYRCDYWMSINICVYKCECECENLWI